MPNNWHEETANRHSPLTHEFEIYDRRGPMPNMPAYHVHPFYEIHIVLKGSITRFTEDSVVDLKPGSVSVYPPDFFHRVTPPKLQNAEADYIRLYLYLRPDYLRRQSSGGLNLAEILDNFGKPANRHLSIPVSEAYSICKPLQEIIHADRDDDPLYHLANSAHVNLFLVWLVEKILHTEDIVLQEENLTIIPSVLTYINTHLNENLSLEQLSERFHFNKFYFAHKFKKYTQLSVHQYVLTKRMLHAQSLLRTGASPLSVAAACGYHEYSSFYKAFLRATGMSPKSFIKKFASD